MSTALSYEWPIITAGDKSAVARTLDDRDLSLPFGATSRLESAVAEFLKCSYVLAHSSGTSALMGAMHAVGVREGTEVVCPSYTWWSSAYPAYILGAAVRYCDIEAENLTLDIADAVANITERTVAIVVPHLWGVVNSIAELRAAVPSQVAIIEDASHLFGATDAGGYVGTQGDIGVFSLQSNKPLAAGEGGLLVTDNEGLLQRAMELGHYERLQTHASKYAGTGLGMKSRMHPLAAALALSQLGRLPASLTFNESLFAAFTAPLSESGLIAVVGQQPGVVHGGRTGGRLIVPDASLREQAIQTFIDSGCPAKAEYLLPLHSQARAKGRAESRAQQSLPVTNRVVPSLVHFDLPTRGGKDTAARKGEEVASRLTRVFA